MNAGPRPLALVTGASSGIGRAFALRLADAGYDVALAARDAERLQAVAADCAARGVEALVLPADLSAAGAGSRLAAQLAGRPVEVLVNNAGFSVHGPFAGTPLGSELAMIRLHVDALLELTKALLPGMIARRRGRILNVGSVYSFAPVAGQAVYGASKAFLLSFSDALAIELAGSGVTVTALCPGITRTEFRERAGVEQGRTLRGLSAEAVVDAGYRGMMAGRSIVIPGLGNRAFALLAAVLGGRLTARVVSFVNRRVRKLRAA